MYKIYDKYFFKTQKILKVTNIIFFQNMSIFSFAGGNNNFSF